MHVIILAGGSGTRLWPLSRQRYPKQFVSLEALGGRSLFQLTLERALRLADPEELRIVAGDEYFFHIVNQAAEISIPLNETQILREPAGKNTLPAIALGLESIAPDAPTLILPSDHFIAGESRFAEIVRYAETYAHDRIITFGVVPTYPETGYGYIEPADFGAEITEVRSFHEKPDSQRASEYIQSGFLWNAGIFLLSPAVFRREIDRANPEFSSVFYTDESTEKRFEAITSESIDYGLLEKSRTVSVAELSGVEWTDLGSFDALANFLWAVSSEKPEIIEYDAQKNFALSETRDKVIALVGVDDLVVIDTPDALLVAKKGATQWAKSIVKSLASQDHPAADIGRTVYRPWGSYTIIDEGPGFKSKRLTVLPGKKLSSQMHHHRSEHWVVVSGTARVEVDGNSILLRKGESTFIPTGSQHRLENPGKITLHLIESQIGDYLEEDDIVRFSDDFGRG